MRIAAIDRYGGPEVVRIREVGEPEIGDHDVLVRVEATTVGPSDSAGRSGTPWFARLFFGLTKPKFPVLGSDYAGAVDRVGGSVTRFAPGDRVFGTVAPSSGAHAELLVAPDDGVIAHAPSRLDPAAAASMLDGFFTAMPFLREGGHVGPGSRVLVNGASGTVGSAAVQLAKHLGAATVVGVCSASHEPLVRSLGADHVIDYTRADFAEARGAYDVIFDAVGKRTFGQCRAALAEGGVYLATVPSWAIMVQSLVTRWFAGRGRRRAVIMFTGLIDARKKAEELPLLVELIESGALVPVIDRVVPFESIVEAYRRVDTGHKAGSVVVSIAAVRNQEAAS